MGDEIPSEAYSVTCFVCRHKNLPQRSLCVSCGTFLRPRPPDRLRAAAQRYRDARQALGGAQREYRLRGEARAVSQEYIDSRDALIEAALAEAGAAGDGAFPPTAICVCTCRGDEHETRWEGDRFVGTRCEAHGGHKFALVAETSEQA